MRRSVRPLATIVLIAALVPAVRWVLGQSVTAGQSFTVLLKSSGTLSAWGDNSYGELGDGTATAQLVPEDLSVSGTFTAVSSGSYHTLALKSDGTVWAWGMNSYGQLGDGTTNQHTTPTQVPGLTGVIAISAGSFHSVAVKSNGTAWAWGNNSYGQLGDGTTTNRPSPTQVLAVTAVTAVGAGANHSLFVQGGQIYGTGYNGYGQLGDGTTTQRMTPVLASGVSSIATVAGGVYHSLAVKSDGTLWAWGYGGYGALGDGTMNSHLTPTQVPGVSGVSRASAATDSLVVLTNGNVWSWGDNTYGQLGNGTTTQNNVPTQVSGLSQVVSVAAGGEHSVAVTSTGIVYTWGYNGSGQLGNGTTTNQTSPVQISNANYVWHVGSPTFSYPTGTYYSALSVTVTCATPGAVIHYTLTGVDPTTSDPTVASGGSVAIGQSATLKAQDSKTGAPSSAVTAATYTLKVPSPTPSVYPSTYTSAQTVSLSDSVAGTAIHYTLDGTDPTTSSPLFSTPLNIATQTTLTARAWLTGWTVSDPFSGTYTFNYGTLAAPTATPAPGTFASSVSVSLAGPSGATIHYTTDGTQPSLTSLAYSAPVVLNQTTTLQAASFRLNYGTSSTTSGVYTIQVATPTLSKPSGAYAAGTTVTVSDATAGATIYYTLDGTQPTTASASIASGGTLVIGNYTLTAAAIKSGDVSSSTVSATYTTTGSVTTAAVAAGNGFSFAVGTDGTLWGWGYNGYGQLGTGTPGQVLIPTIVTLLTGVKAAAAGGQHALALRTDGTVWAMGFNGYGQLGDGTTNSHSVPFQVPGLSGITAIAAGASHSLALKSDGTVWAWGFNASGQLGDGTTTTRLSPVQVSGLTGATGIGVGDNHSLALKAGAIWAWGSNGNGQLGDGTTTSHSAPVQVTGLTSVSSIAGSTYDTIALKTDGTVWTWGYGAYGLMGNGSLTDRSTPGQVTGVSGVVAIALGGNHALVAKSDGTVWAWGSNSSSELGDGTTTQRNSPIQVPGLASIVGVSAGQSHSLAVSTAGDVYAWGNNASGQLGDGTTNSETTPLQVSDANHTWLVATPSFSYPTGTYNSALSVTVSSATPGAVIHYTLTGVAPTISDPVVASGGTVAISQTATLEATAFKTGFPTSETATAVYSLQPYAPYPSPYPSTYASAQTVTLNDSTPGVTIRYTLDGSDPTTSSPAYSTPLTIGTQTTLSARAWLSGWGVSTLFSGTYYFDFATLGTPTASPAAGQYTSSVSVSLSGPAGAAIHYTLDGSSPSASSPTYTTPIVISSATTLQAQAYEANYGASAVLTAAYTIQVAAPTLSKASGSYPAGTAIAVTEATPGSTMYYTLDGTVPTTASPTIASGGTVVVGNYTLSVKAVKTGCIDSPVVTAAFTESGALDTVAVAAGWGDSFALVPDGTLWAWGYNGYGELGDGTVTQQTVPEKLNDFTGAKAIVAGLYHTLFLRSDGTVWASGYNGYGQLGNGTNTSDESPSQVPGLANITAIAAGDYHSLALKSDGTVWAWGYNGDGQLGDGTTVTRLSPVQVSGLTGASAIGAGSNHSLAVKAGVVWAWGNNGNGEVGDGTTTQRNAPVQLSGLTSVSAVRGSQYNSLALKTDGTVWTWGMGAYGVLGDGTTADRSHPAQIPSFSPITAVALGGTHAVVVKSDGTVWAWGTNSQGELGDGTTTQRNAPVQVVGVTSAVGVAAGAYHSLAVTATGVVYAWGQNTYGEVGDGTTTNRPTPIQESGPNYSWDVGTPNFSYPSGTYDTALSVVVSSATRGVTIHYTLSGVDPTASDATVANGGTVAISQTETLKAKAFLTGAPTSATATAAYVLQPYAPAASPGPATYTSAQTVSLSDYTPGATIRYTLDGGTPTASSTAYVTPLNIATQTTLTAIAFVNGWTPSPVLVGAYNFNYGTLAAPTSSPGPGNFISSVTVTLSGPSGATIRYTTDGTTPSASSTAYSSALALSQTTTVQAASFRQNYTTSAVASFAYTVSAATPTLSLASGVYAAGTTVTVTDSTAGSTLYYTLDGSNPTTSSPTIASGGQLTLGNFTLTVMAVKPGCTNSPTATATYSISSGPVTTLKLAAGNDSSWVVEPDGVMWTFGLGNTVPSVFSGTTNIRNVSIGDTFEMVLRGDGSVWAWGTNESGELGDGTFTSHSWPAPVQGLTNVIAIAAGGLHGLALKSDGTVWSWGYNADGELGQGTTLSSPTAKQITGLPAISQIAAGEFHSLAVDNSGNVWVWGQGTSGELGVGKLTNLTSPTKLTSITSVMSVAGGARHSLAVKADGTVWAWGWGQEGELGDGEVAFLYFEVAPVQTQLLTSIVSVSTRYQHSLAVASNGTLWAWGSNSYGQLGVPYATNTFGLPIRVPGLPTIVSAAAGNLHSLAEATDGTLFAWGDNIQGDLGNGTLYGSPTPIENSGPSEGWLVATPTVSVGSGVYNTAQSVVVSCATRGATINYTLNGVEPAAGDSVVASGGTIPINASLTLKLKAFKTGSPPSDTETAVYSLQPATPVATPTPGTYSTAQSIQLSSATSGATVRYTLDGSDPTTSSPVASGAIAVSTQTTVTARAWLAGWDPSAPLVATYSFSYGTVPAISVSPAAGTYLDSATVTISVPSNSVVYYTTDGSQPTTGSTPYSGPFLISQTETVNAQAFRQNYTPSPVVSNLYTIKVSTPVLSQPGGTYPVGYSVTINDANPDATLYYRTDGVTPTAADSPLQPGQQLLLGNFALTVGAFKDGCSASDIVAATYSIQGQLPTPSSQLALGATYGLYLDEQGTLYGWGLNLHGELADNTTISHDTPVKITSISGIKKVAAGGTHVLALKNDGTLWGWGDNQAGEVGDGTFTSRLLPVEVDLLDVVDIAAGAQYSMAITSDGRVWTWGTNDSGQLGLGDFINRAYPYQMTLTSISHVAAGFEHALGLTTDGRVFSWGRNAEGQLGLGTTGGNYNSPTQLPTSNRYSAISAGDYHSLALLSTGALQAFGSNTYGQLGTGTTTSSSTPVTTSLPTGATTFVAGSSFSLVCAGGSCTGVGLNNESQLGIPNIAIVTAPTAIPFLSSVVQVVASGTNAGALTAGGRILIWGSGSGPPKDLQGNVVLASTAGPPLVVLGCPATCPPSYWWGDTVQVQVSGLQPLSGPDSGVPPEAVVAHFRYQAIPASSVTASDGGIATVSFKVPYDAVGGNYLKLSYRAQTSQPADGGVPINISPPTIFSNIRSIVAGPPGADGGHVYIADNTAIWDSLLFERAYAPPAQLVAGANLLGRVTRTNKLYYVSIAKGAPTVYVRDLGNGSTTAWGSTANLGTSIQPVAFAVTEDGTQAFIADGLSSKLIEVTVNGAAFLNATGPLSFPSPMGMDVLNNVLTIGQQNSTVSSFSLEGYPGTTTTSSFIPHGVLGDRDGYDFDSNKPTRFLYMNDTAIAEVFNPNTNMRAYLAASADGSHVLLSASQTLGFLDSETPLRVLLRNIKMRGLVSAPYPTTSQISDAIIKYTFYSFAGVTVYIRVVDPPDTAPYVAPPASRPTYYANDNFIPDAGERWGLANSAGALSWSKCASLKLTDVAPGQPSYIQQSIYLRVPISGAGSGDNFRLEISRVPFAECTGVTDGGVSDAGVFGASALATTWKRVYVEAEKMYTRGAPLRSDVVADAGAILIIKLNETPWDAGVFSAIDGLDAGDQIVLFGSTLDAGSDAPRPQETACVGSRIESPKFVTLELVACGGDGGTYHVQNAYSANYDNKQNDDLDFGLNIPGISGVGAANGVGPFFAIDFSNYATPFTDGYVEFVMLPAVAGSGVLPLVPGDWFERVYNPGAKNSPGWFERATDQEALLSNDSFLQLIPGDGGAGARIPVSLPHNVLHVLAVTKEDNVWASPPVGHPGWTRWQWGASFIGLQSTDGGISPSAFNWALVHELGHHFHLNECGDPDGGHDSRQAWFSTTQPPLISGSPCVMAQMLPDGGTDLVGFCLQDLLTGDPTSSCSQQRRQVSIRGALDPLSQDPL